MSNNDPATKQDLQNLETRIDKKLDRLDKKIDDAVVDLSNIIQDFAKSMSDEIIEIKARQDAFDKKLDQLISTMDSFIARIDGYESEMAARDAQFDRLLEWARKVSKKTGIPLENI